MTHLVLLALGRGDDGRPAALARGADARPLVAELLDRVVHHGPVTVVARGDDHDAVAAATSGAGAEVLAADDLAAVLAVVDAVHAEAVAVGAATVVLDAHVVADPVSLGHLADGATRGTASVVEAAAARRRHDTERATTSAPGGQVAARPAPDRAARGDLGSDTTCRRMHDSAVPRARGDSSAPRARGDDLDAAAVRVSRGRVVAAASSHHPSTRAEDVAVGALRLGPGDRAEVAAAVAALAALAGEPAGQGAGIDAGAEDVVALLTVALVRGGTPVAAQRLARGAVWERPTDAAAAVEASRRAANVDAERLRLSAAVKADDGAFTTFLVSPYSRYWARWAARRGLSPNTVTIVSMLVGIAAAAGFATGTSGGTIAGAVLLQLAFTLDCVDGQLARYARRFSTLGAWLDSVFDRGKEYVVLAGLALGAVRAGDDASLVWTLAAAALALQTLRHTLDFGYAAQQEADLAVAVRQPLTPGPETGPSRWEGAAIPAPTPVSRADAGSRDAEVGDRESAPPSSRADAGRGDAEVGDRESAPPSSRADAGSRGESDIPRRAIALLRRAEAVPVLAWGKRIVPLPIGERFALISIVAVAAGPTAVLVALLAWGSLAAAYTAGGRVLRSLA